MPLKYNLHCQAICARIVIFYIQREVCDWVCDWFATGMRLQCDWNATGPGGTNNRAPLQAMVPNATVLEGVVKQASGRNSPPNTFRSVFTTCTLSLWKSGATADTQWTRSGLFLAVPLLGRTRRVRLRPRTGRIRDTLETHTGHTRDTANNGTPRFQ